MNPSFFAFPQQTNLHQLGIRTYDSSGVYEIMPGTEGLYIFAVSGGGGGGGGGRRPTSGNCNGGAGGAGGASGLWYFRVEEIGGIGSSLFIVIGAGGTAGSAGSADGTSGGTAGQGGSTRIYSLGRGQTVQTYANARASLISLFNDQLTGAGGGSTSSASGQNGNGYFSEVYGYSGGNSQGAASASNITVYTINHSGGAGGGGHTAGTPTSGGSINISVATTIPQTIALDDAKNTAAYQGGGANNGVQPANSSKQIFGLFSPGFGGAGGASGTSQAATNGGNGYRGSGGGGGGGSANGFAAGAGGVGGNGFVAIKAVFS